MTEPEVTLEEKLACAKRELALRKAVYDRFVETKKISRQRADHELRVMAAIVVDYEAACSTGTRENPGDFQRALDVIGGVQDRAYQHAIELVERGGSPQEIADRIRKAISAAAKMTPADTAVTVGSGGELVIDDGKLRGKS